VTSQAKRIITHLENAGLTYASFTPMQDHARISTILPDGNMHVEIIRGVVTEQKLNAVIAKCKEPA
jgi:hypothetical protein